MANLTSVVGKLRKAYRDWEAGADERARAKIAKAATKGVRESQLHALRMQKLARKQELEEAVAKLKEAEAKRKRAEKELKQQGNGVLSRLFGTSKPKAVQTTSQTRARRKTKHKTARKATVYG